MSFRDVGVDMTVYTLTEKIHADIQEIRIPTVFHAISFLHVSQLPVPVQKLEISNSKPRSTFVTINVVHECKHWRKQSIYNEQICFQ